MDMSILERERPPYMSPQVLAAALVESAHLDPLVAKCLELNEIDTDVLQFLDENSYKEAGILSSLDRAKIQGWGKKHGYIL